MCKFLLKICELYLIYFLFPFLTPPSISSEFEKKFLFTWSDDNIYFSLCSCGEKFVHCAGSLKRSLAARCICACVNVSVWDVY